MATKLEHGGIGDGAIRRNTGGYVSVVLGAIAFAIVSYIYVRILLYGMAPTSDVAYVVEGTLIFAAGVTILFGAGLAIDKIVGRGQPKTWAVAGLAINVFVAVLMISLHKVAPALAHLLQ